LALDKLIEQYNLARAIINGTKPLGICEGDYSQQFGLPYKYIIHRLLESKETNGRVAIVASQALTLVDLDSFWYLK